MKQTMISIRCEIFTIYIIDSLQLTVKHSGEVRRKDKLLHGMYHRQIEEVADVEKCYQWLQKAGLKDSTEALIMAAQEQALNTRAEEAGVYQT